ncbi:MAG: MFS transporter [Candidatus Paracaedibacteraceae bacterium]|nr:MFS transporter [Candidatus Paracaedibacteraceae bacterium]
MTVTLQTLLYGFMSGFCLLLSGNTLNFWLAESGINLITLGLFSLVALPYSLKYPIALLVDRLPLKDAYKLFFASIGLTYSLWQLSTTPITNFPTIALWASLIATAAVIQDIYLDKYRIDKTHAQNSGHSAGGYITGYRLGMLASGAGLIYASTVFEWATLFKISAMLCLLLGALVFSTFPPQHRKHKPSSFQNFWRPILKIGKGRDLMTIIAIIILYRLADNLLAILVNPFQLSLGFTAAEIATASKVFGTAMALLGGIIGGKLLQTHTVSWGLLTFGLIHLITHGLFILQTHVGYNLPLLYLVNGAESLTGSMAMVSYIAFITSLCNKRFGTVQYALLSSVMGFSRTLIPSSVGLLAQNTTWTTTFTLITLTGIPGLMLCWYRNK